MSSLANADRLINSWMKEMGIEEGSKYWKKVKLSQLPFLTSVHSPGVLLHQEYPILLMIFLFLILGKNANRMSNMFPCVSTNMLRTNDGSSFPKILFY